LGPVHPPIRKPAASGSTNDQRTGANTANPTAATKLASPLITFLSAFSRARASSIIIPSTASSSTPPPAPK
jgi:hypothetical protein